MNATAKQLLCLGLFLAGLPAQETAKPKNEGPATGVAEKGATESGATGNGATEKGATEKGATEKGATRNGAPANAAGAQPETWARISSAGCRVRCFASNLSPVYEEELKKGTVVAIGEAVGEYRRIRLPLGVPGYVSKRFTTEPEDGMVRTTGKLVSFRYRPTPKNRAEQPVQLLPQDTGLHFLGETGDWWKVRLVTESAYVPLGDLALIEEAGVAVRKDHAALADAYDAEWRAAVARYEGARKAAAAAVRQQARLTELRELFATETRKPLREQALKPILEGVAVLVAELPEDGELLTPANFLRDAIERQQVFVDADVVLSTKPKPAEPRIRVHTTPEDRLGAKLDSIGWLTYRPAAGGPAAYRLEKGGRVISYLYCNSLRYDLAMFAGVEIGVKGVLRRDAVVPYLDVQHIQVLTAN